MVPYYPKVFHLSIALEKRIEKILEEEKDNRQDLYTMALGCVHTYSRCNQALCVTIVLPYSYAGKLKTHKTKLIPESEFHIREERVKAQQSDHKDADGVHGNSSKSSKSNTTPTHSSAKTSSKITPGSSKATPARTTPTSKPKDSKPQEKNSKEPFIKVTEASTLSSSAGGKNSAKSSRSSSGERSHSPSEAKTREKGGNGTKSSSSLSTTARKSRPSIETTSSNGDEKGGCVTIICYNYLVEHCIV